MTWLRKRIVAFLEQGLGSEDILVNLRKENRGVTLCSIHREIQTLRDEGELRRIYLDQVAAIGQEIDNA